MEAAGVTLFGVEVAQNGSQSVVRIYVEGQNGATTVDDCSRASRQVSSALDVADIVSGRYHLEVSSPGIERSLFELEQYVPFIGHDIKLRLHAPLNARKNFVGQLRAVTEAGEIQLASEEGEVTIPYTQIAKANVVAKGLK